MADLIESFDNGVLSIVFNRPERKNALSGEMLTMLNAALQRAALDPKVRCVLLSGAEGSFCVGGDVKGFAAGGGAGGGLPMDQRAANLRQAMESSRLLHEMPKPCIAAIEGAAAGAGLSLAMACDIRICGETAKITTAFAKVGLSGDFGGTYFLSQLVGPAKARELYLLSPVLSGREAAAMNIVSRAVPDADVLKEARALARNMADGPTVTYGLIKKNFIAAEAGTLKAALDAESLHHSLSSATEDHKEASKAFVEKRKPAFVGR
ncbi:MAG: enoyl-CoA hydratase [Rhodoblastus sp.]|nr:enoyl-CoA hydratase [Rhodoblastus sp.]